MPLGMCRYTITKALDKLLDRVRLVLATSSPRGCSSWLCELWLQVGNNLNNNVNNTINNVNNTITKQIFSSLHNYVSWQSFESLYSPGPPKKI